MLEWLTQASTLRKDPRRGRACPSRIVTERDEASKLIGFLMGEAGSRRGTDGRLMRVIFIVMKPRLPSVYTDLITLLVVAGLLTERRA